MLSNIIASDPQALLAREVRLWAAPGVTVSRREFYAVDGVITALESNWRPGRFFADDAEAEAARREAIAVVSLWSRGRPLIARTQLKPMEPPPPGADCSWEFRAVAPRPGSRIIGLVPERNTFIATGVYPRKYLGRRGSPEWMKALGLAFAKAHAWGLSSTTIKWPIGVGFDHNGMANVCDDI